MAILTAVGWLIVDYTAHGITQTLYAPEIKFTVHSDKIEVFRVAPDKSVLYKLGETEPEIDRIDTAFLYDVDHDGRLELVALVWMHQDYFDNRDYLKPIRGDLPSQHIRIYDISPGLSLKWGGSTMQPPVTEFGLCGDTIKTMCGYTSDYDNFPKKLEHISLSWDGWSLGIHEFADTTTLPSIFIAGETMLARQVGDSLRKYPSKTYLFDSFKPYLKQSTLAILPLENTFVTNPKDCGDSCLVLQGDAKLIPTLRQVGFDLVMLGSNHQGDAGQAGYITTTSELKRDGIQYTGVGNNPTGLLEPTISHIGNLNIGVISADDVRPDYWYVSGNDFGVNSFSQISQGHKSIDTAKIKQLAKIKHDHNIDFLIVHESWGIEYQDSPSDYQVELAHQLIDLGSVDFIFGTHPHVTQSTEVYKNKYIFYSLGNFIFDQTNQDSTRTGIALNLRLNDQIKDNFDGYLADIEVIHYQSCGPQQSNLDLTQPYLNESISLETLSQDRDRACVYYMPVVL